MLDQFIADYEERITDRASQLARAHDLRVDAQATKADIAAFLALVGGTLRQRDGAADAELLSTSSRLGAIMLRAGQPIEAVLQWYGGVREAVITLAAEARFRISVEDLCAFSRCLDDAVARAAGEYLRIADERQATAENQRMGIAAHELRDQLHTARLSLRALQSSGVPIDGPSGQLLDRTLGNLATIVERIFSTVRLGADVTSRESIELAAFVEEVAMTAALSAESSGVTFTVDAETAGAIDGDRHQLMSAVMNVVHNAVKFTKPGGDVRLTVRMTASRLFIAVQDQCGGLAQQITNTLTDRRRADRSGLRLGLPIAKKIIRAHAGDIMVRNVPGCGCVFTIELPVAPVPVAARCH